MRAHIQRSKLSARTGAEVPPRAWEGEMPSYEERFESAIGAGIAGATVLTGNRRAARHLMSCCERRLRQTHAGWYTPDILPLDAWLRRTWEEALLGGSAVPLALLNQDQSAEVWEKIVLEDHPNIANPAAAARVAAEAWRLAQDFEIALLPRDFSSPEARTFLGWTEKFSRYCAAEGRMDAAKLTAAVAGLLPAIAPELRDQFVFYGLDELTPAQQRLIAVLQSAGKQVTLLLSDNLAGSQPALKVALRDTRQELFAAARWAATRLGQQPEARIGVVVFEMAALRSEVELAFTEVLQPNLLFTGNLSAARTFDLSLGKPLDSYPVVHLALLALALLLDDVAADEASLLVRSPYLDGCVAEAGARAGFDLFLRKQTKGRVTASSLLALLSHEKNPDRCPQLTRLLAAARQMALQQQSSRSGRLRPSAWSTAVNRVLEAMAWARPEAGERPLDSTEFQTVGSWTQLLESLALLDAVLPAITPAQMLLRLRRMAAAQIFQPESQNAPVQIMGVLEAAGSTFDLLWICGATDDAWPAHAPPNPFLPSELQRRSGVPHASAAQELTFAEKVKARLLASAREVVWSWPMRQEDRELRPSSLLSDIGLTTTEELGVGAETERWSAWPRAEALEEFAAGAAPPPALDKVLRGGTGIFELQSNCPFRAFAEVRLHAGELREAVTGLSPVERGQIVECALQFVWEHLRDHFTLENTHEADLAKIIDRAAQHAMEAAPAPSEDWERRYREIEERRVARLLHEWLASEKQREPFKVVAHQRQVPVEAGGVRVTGRLDRLDQTQDGHLVVLDYKTGKGQYGPGQWNGDRPRMPQLPLYVTSQTQPVSGVAFAVVEPGASALQGYAVRPKILARERFSKSSTGGADFDAYIGRWPGVLEAIGNGFAQGIADVDPLAKACDNCHLQALCRIAEQERSMADEEPDGGSHGDSNE